MPGCVLGWTLATALPQIECALSHDKVRLIANALGTPPPDVIQSIHGTGRKVAALCMAIALLVAPSGTESQRRVVDARGGVEAVEGSANDSSADDRAGSSRRVDSPAYKVDVLQTAAQRARARSDLGAS